MKLKNGNLINAPAECTKGIYNMLDIYSLYIFMLLFIACTIMFFVFLKA